MGEKRGFDLLVTDFGPYRAIIDRVQGAAPVCPHAAHYEEKLACQGPERVSDEEVERLYDGFLDTPVGRDDPYSRYELIRYVAERVRAECRAVSRGTGSGSESDGGR